MSIFVAELGSHFILKSFHDKLPSSHFAAFIATVVSFSTRWHKNTWLYHITVCKRTAYKNNFCNSV